MKGVNAMHTHSTIPSIPLLSKRSPEVFRKCIFILMIYSSLFIFCMSGLISSTLAQQVLFDFDGIPIGTTLPITQTIGGITAHFAGTYPGYSIQDANVLGFTPPGFSGHIIYPNSINLADLLISFDQSLTDFSIMYSVQELACDTSATMRVTAYMNGSYVGTNTTVAFPPGTWPVDTLICSFPQGFDSIVVHYDSPPPPPCQDYGTIFMADNMRVTPLSTNTISEGELPVLFTLSQNYPNPFNPVTTIIYQLPESEFVTLKIYDILGREVAELVNGEKIKGQYKIDFDASKLASGVYIYQLRTNDFVSSKKMQLLK